MTRCFLATSTEENCIEDIMQVLLTDEVTHVKDHGGNMPLEILTFR